MQDQLAQNQLPHEARRIHPVIIFPFRMPESLADLKAELAR